MAYASEIDLGGLGQAPKTTDPETYADFTDVYNAIHILAQWTNMLYEHEKSKAGDNPDAPNYENFPLDRFIWEVAAMDIREGEFVSRPPPFLYPSRLNNIRDHLRNGAFAGWVALPSAVPHELSLAIDYNTYAAFGIATNDAKKGEKVRIAVGPGYMKFPGAKSRDTVYVSNTKWTGTGNNIKPTGRGNFYLVPPTGGPYNLRGLTKFSTIHNDDELYIPPATNPGFPPGLLSTIKNVFDMIPRWDQGPGGGGI